MKKLFIILSMLMSVAAYGETGSYALYDYNAAMYAVRYNHMEVRSIASITKLFTAITVIRSGVDLNEKIFVDGRSKGHVPRGVYMTRMDLMRSMIISSDNRAAETLAYHHPGGFDKFLFDVNNYVKDNTLENTTIVDSTGLKEGNKSTVRELVEFLYKIKDEPVIRKIANERNVVLNVPRGKKVIRINIRNTNPDMFIYDNILISKTGFTNPAGRCVLMLVEKNKELFGVVVLGQTNVRNRSRVVGNLLSMDVEPTPTPKISSTLIFDL